jgi:hypothetical protein
MSNANVEIVLDTGGNIDAKMHEAAASVDHLNERVASVGESFTASFENLPGLLSGGGIEGIVGGIGNQIGSLGSSVASGLSELGPFGAALGLTVGAAAAAGAAFVGLGVAIANIVGPQMEAITSTFKLAEALGVPTDALMTFEAEAKRTAGVAAEDIPQAFERLAKTIGEATEGSKGAEKAFAQLGLSASTLKGQGLDVSFEQIADKISRLGSVSEQAAAATAIFGREGAKLIPLFNEGSAGIERAHAEMLKFGEALTDVDAAKVAAAQEVFETLGKRIEGVKDVLTVTLAPTIQALGDQILKLLPDADTLKTAFVDGLHFVADAVGYVIDGWELFKQTVLSLEDDAVASFAAILKSAEDMVQGLIAAANKLPGIHIEMPKGLEDFQQTIGLMAADIHQQYQEQLNKPLATDGIDDFFKHVNAASDQAAKDMLEHSKRIGGAIGSGIKEGVDKAKGELDKILDEAKKSLDFQKYVASDEGKSLKSQGLNEGDLKKVFDVEQAGADPKSADVQHLVEMLKAAEQLNKAQAAGNKMMEDAKRVFDETRTPLEKYQQDIAQLNAELAAGAINSETYDRAAKMALEKEREAEKPKTPGKKDADHEHDFATETRRFTKELPSTGTDAKSGQKAQVDILTMSERWLRDIRNSIVNPGGQAQGGVSIDQLA